MLKKTYPPTGKLTKRKIFLKKLLNNDINSSLQKNEIITLPYVCQFQNNDSLHNDISIAMDFIPPRLSKMITCNDDIARKN